MDSYYLQLERKYRKLYDDIRIQESDTTDFNMNPNNIKISIFEYKKDNWRASQVRNMGKVFGDSTFSDNDWEEVKEKADDKIKKWIDCQLKKRSCLIVLIGSTTANRKWINYEIEQAYKTNKGIVGIYIHKLKDCYGNQTTQGNNPFDYVYTKNGIKLSNYVKTFNSSFVSSEYVFSDIENNIEQLIENAIERSGTY